MTLVTAKNETAVETRAYACACENARNRGMVKARAKHECCCTPSVISIKSQKEMLYKRVSPPVLHLMIDWL